MKRSGGGKAGNPDFKRLKAKVGKRAPKKLNSTDTSFKAASIRVASQIQSLQRSDAGDPSNVAQLVSSKVSGKNLQSLTEALSHHVLASRKSALTGIRDIISQCSTSHQGNVRDLFVFVLALLARHACVDEDDEVRESARLGLNSLFAALTHSQDLDEDAVYVIQPFVPLLSAYILSGLNSLDNNARRDAVAVAELCFMTFPRAFGDGRAHSMIPALLKVLSSTRRKISDVSKKKKKKKKKSRETASSNAFSNDLNSEANVGGRVATLRALITIMRASDRIPNDNFGFTTVKYVSSSHKFNFILGGIGSNALLLTRNSPSRVAKSCFFCGHEPSTVDLSMIFNEKDKRNPLNSVSNEERVSLSTCIDVLQKLRDYWVELMQTGIKHGPGIAIRLGDVDEASAILQAMSIFWRQYCKSELAETKVDLRNSDQLKLQKVAQGIITLQLQDFPIRDDSGNMANTHHYNVLNALLCSFLSEIGSAIGVTDWAEAAFSYIFQRLKVFSEDLNDGDSIAGTKLIMLIGQLLRKPSAGIYHRDYLLTPEQRWDLLAAFAGPFFPDEENIFGAKEVMKSLFSSRAGKNAAVLIADLIIEQGDKIVDEGIAISRELIRNAHVFPFYLHAWQGESSIESSVILESLFFICRKWNGRTGVEDHVNQSLTKLIKFLQRDGLDVILTSGRKRKQKHAASSTFEKMDRANQQKVISLIGMIQSPSDGTVKSLSDIIVRNRMLSNEEGVSSSNIKFIFEVLHANRKSISFPEYLNFIMSSSGVSHLKKRSMGGVDAMDVFSYDYAIERTSNAVVNCGGFKIISKIFPILLDWLSHVSEFENASYVEAVMARSGITLLAKCAFDIKNDHGADLLFASCIDLKASVINAMCTRLLLFKPLKEPSECDMNGEEQFLKKFLGPVISILDSIPSLWYEVLDTTEDFVRDSCSKRQDGFNDMTESKIDGIRKSETIVKGVSFLLSECHVDSILSRKLLCTKLLDFSQRIMETFSNIATSFPSLHDLGQKLNITVRLMIGATN